MITAIRSFGNKNCLSTLAYCQKFKNNSDFFTCATGSVLLFYNVKYNNNEMNIEPEFEYKLFDDIALLIPYYENGMSLLIVIFYSTSFCVLKYQENSILSIQNSKLASSGVVTENNDRYSYSLYHSLLLVQTVYDGIMLYRIIDGKLVFIQNIEFLSSLIYRFCFIDKSHYGILLNKFNRNTVYEVHKFDLFRDQVVSSLYLPKKFNNFYIHQKVTIFISKDAFREYKSKTLAEEKQVELIDEDIFDMVKFGNNNFLLVSITGKIFSINSNDYNIFEFFGSVMKPLNIIFFETNKYIIPSKYGETKFIYHHEGNYVSTLLSFPGYVTKFVQISNRKIIGLTKTCNLHKFEKSPNLNPVYTKEFDFKSQCWFIDDENILVSSSQNKTSKIFSIVSKTFLKNSTIKIISCEETIGFKLLKKTESSFFNFIQITPSTIFMSPNNYIHGFSDIVLSYFDNNNFAVCEKYYIITIFINDNDVILRHELDYQINLLALSNDVLVVSSWIRNSLYILSIISNEEGSALNQIGAIDDVSIIDMCFINNGLNLIALSSRNYCYIFSKNNNNFVPVNKFIFSHLNNKLFFNQNDEVFITGKNVYFMKDFDITKIRNIKTFHHFDCFKRKIMLCHNDNTLSIYVPSNQYNISFKSKKVESTILYIVKIPKEPLNSSNIENINRYSVVFYKENNGVFLSITNNIFETSVCTNLLTNKRKNFIDNQIIFDKISNRISIVITFLGSLVLYELRNQDIIKKAEIFFESKPIGSIKINDGLICVIFIDMITLYSIEYDNIEQMKTIETQGATKCFNFNNNILTVGDSLDSIVVYEFQRDSFQEIHRYCIAIGASSCIEEGKEKFTICVDQTGFLYKMKKSATINFSSKNLDIIAACFLGSCSSAMISFPDKDHNSIIIGTKNGDIIECADAPCPLFSMKLYKEVESTLISLGNISNKQLRQVLSSNIVLGIPRIIDIDLLKMFLELNNEQKSQILSKLPNDEVPEAIQAIYDIINYFVHS